MHFPPSPHSPARSNYVRIYVDRNQSSSIACFVFVRFHRPGMGRENPPVPVARVLPAPWLVLVTSENIHVCQEKKRLFILTIR